MPEVTLRPAIASDVDAICLCAKKAYNKYIERIGKAPAPMIADFASAVAAQQVLVACSDDSLLGYVVFYQAGDSMHLENVAVYPDVAGSGIGRQLISQVEEAAKSQGLESVELYTNEAMTENLTMYPAIGYEEFDRRVEGGFNRVYFRKFV